MARDFSAISEQEAINTLSSDEFAEYYAWRSQQTAVQAAITHTVNNTSVIYNADTDLTAEQEDAFLAGFNSGGRY